MKAHFYGLFLFGVVAALAETPKEVALRIIAAESPTAYNALNSTAEELNRASAVNSQLQLRQLMLGDSISEELRACYALRLIQERRGLVRLQQPANAIEQKLERDQSELAAYLRHLNDSTR